MGIRDSLNGLLIPWVFVWQKSWGRRKKIDGRLFQIELFIIGMILLAGPYFITNIVAHNFLETVWDPEIPLDRQIPFIGWTIIPYVGLYALYPLLVFSSPRNKRGQIELLVSIQFLFFVTIFCCIFFLLVPAEIDLRDQLVIPSLNPIEEFFFSLVHHFDNPWNAWPSLHIVHSFLICRIVTFWTIRERKETKKRTLLLLLLWTEWVLLSISILTTKQHYIFDLFSGILVSLIFWQLFYPVINGTINWKLENITH